MEARSQPGVLGTSVPTGLPLEVHHARDGWPTAGTASYREDKLV